MIVNYSDTFFNYFSIFGSIFSKPQFKNLLSIGNVILSSELSKNVSQISREVFRNINRSSLSRFLTVSPWDMNALNSQRIIYSFEKIQSESDKSNKPIFLSIDDTLISKSTKRDKVEGISKQFSHVTGKYEYGHVLLALHASSNSLSLPISFEIYNTKEFCEEKSIDFKSKNTMALDLITALPLNEENKTYLLADRWFSSEELINSALQKGIYSIMPIKSNRIIYPKGIGVSVKTFASNYIDIDSLNSVTVKNEKYRVFRYEGNLNKISNAVVLISYKMIKGKPSEPMYILSTDIELSDEKIIEYYLNRWDIEVSFRYQKNSLGLKDCQMRSLTGMKKFWSIIYLVHTFVLFESFEESKNNDKTPLGRIIKKHRIESFRDMIEHICKLKDSGEQTQKIIDKFINRVA